MLIKVEHGAYDYYAENDYEMVTDFHVIETYYFDNIDRAKAYVENKLSGKDWSANHPGMVFDMYVYDKQYFTGAGISAFMIKAFKFYKIEMV